MDIKWEVHKRTQQGVSAKLESYIYKVHMVCATNNYACPYIHATTSLLWTYSLGLEVRTTLVLEKHKRTQ